jgi:3-hydroxyacyl-[acyl-carrier-protein] dehydratase
MILDFEQIKNLIPQRFPFIMIDKVLEVEPDNYIISLKNITVNDIFFPGHFPENPILPGFLILEAMSQTAIVLFAYSTLPPFGKGGFSNETKENNKRLSYYIGSVKARFLHPIVPGDQLKIKVANVKSLPTVAFVEVEASVDDKKVSEAELVFSMKEEKY